MPFDWKQYLEEAKILLVARFTFWECLLQLTFLMEGRVIRSPDRAAPFRLIRCRSVEFCPGFHVRGSCHVRQSREDGIQDVSRHHSADACDLVRRQGDEPITAGDAL